MAFFRIDSKVFSLAFDGDRIDSYAIHEQWGKFHGSIRVGRLGFDWIIACLADLISGTFENNTSSNVYARILNFWRLPVDLTRQDYLWKSLNTTMVQDGVARSSKGDQDRQLGFVWKEIT